MKRFIFALGLFLAGLTASAVGQGVNPITPPTNWLIQVLDPAFANPSNFYTTPTLLGGDLTNLNVVAGTLAPNATAFSLTATQPASPMGTQNTVNWTCTSAGSASQANTCFNANYNAGYTGSGITKALSFTNNVAGTSATLVPTGIGINGNSGIYGASFGAGSGVNFGGAGTAANAPTNVGLVGSANSGTGATTNVGVMGYALGGTNIIAGYFHLRQTTAPTVTAALVADNAAQSAAIALWLANGVTTASVNATGGLTATLTSASGTSSVCNTAGTSTLLTLVASGTACGSSALRTKDAYRPEALNLAGLDDLRTDVPWAYRKDSDSYDGGKIHVGLFADDIKAMDPRCVVYDTKGELLNYFDRCVLTYLVADRKALKARIAALEEKVH